MSNKKRLKILFIPTWYPSKQNSAAGIFIKEHTKAVSLANAVNYMLEVGPLSGLFIRKKSLNMLERILAMR
jgi:hypothetical protein